MCEIDVYIHFWDNCNKQVNVRYWGSEFLGHGTSKDLATSLNKSIESLNHSHSQSINHSRSLWTDRM